MDKIYTVAILGAGARGADAYGQLIHKEKEKFKIVALCDKKQARLDRFQKEFEVEEENCFLDENKFFEKKRADLLVIATQDADHVRHAIKAFETGYDVLVEKPLSDNKDECNKLLEMQKKYGRKAVVCHVLRYAPAFLKIAELLDDGVIGKLVAINALERVCYHHQAHSYVRGNWRNRETATPMILAKCCHDLDLLQYYAKSKCLSVSSVGNLAYFKEENAPIGAAKRCSECKYYDDCVYSAKWYVKNWKKQNCPADEWPFNVVTQAPTTEEKLEDAIKTSPYGRCVFRCDNNVVDHQLTNMTFENGIKASLTMTGFTAGGGRRIHFFGTLGEMLLDEFEGIIAIRPFEKEATILPIDSLLEKGYGHGGGDVRLIKQLYEILQGSSPMNTSLENSVESHLMGIAAEESRLKDGELIYIHQ